MRSVDQRLQKAQNAQATRQEDLEKGRIRIERTERPPSSQQSARPQPVQPKKAR